MTDSIVAPILEEPVLETLPGITLEGGNGADELFGSPGNDVIDGGNGSDILYGGVGSDTLTGGNGPDIFVLAAQEGTDTITDFTQADLIGLSGGITFEHLSFSGEAIILSSTSEVLATLIGVDTTTLTESDFIEIDDDLESSNPDPDTASTANTVQTSDLLLQPNLVQPSDLTVRVEYVGTMPFVERPGFIIQNLEPNLASPVAIHNTLYLIDQNDAIYRFNGTGNGQAPSDALVQEIFDVSEAPDGLLLDNRQSIVNISEGSSPNSIYVMFTSGSEPTTDIPIYRMPDPLPGECCNLENPLPVEDIYRIGTIPDPVGSFLLGDTRTEYQVLYEYKLAGNQLKEGRAIASFETQSGPTHNGGGMLTLSDGRILFATGDALPLGADGRAAPQDPTEHVGKLLLINPEDGSIEVAAQGVRNVQRLQLIPNDDPSEVLVGFADIGGVTAEEVNYVRLADLLDTSTIENFGWGRNEDGNAREGTFYIGPGVPLVQNTDPPVIGRAPSPEPGFIQPHAQYSRNDPNGGIAVSGPVISDISFSEITSLFGDLGSGLAYATTDPLTGTDVEVKKVNLIDEDGTPLTSFNDLADDPNLARVDPRFFLFPDGTAGVLLEKTGEFFRLTEEVANSSGVIDQPIDFLEGEDVMVALSGDSSVL